MPLKPENSSAPTEHLYEYAVVRVMPRVERDEFVNVGLVMMCKRRRWLRVRTEVPAALLRALDSECDIDAIARQLESFDLVASGKSDSPIAETEVHERFRWLTAVRSACIVTSRPHPGLSTDLDATFDRLYGELVAR